MILTRTWRGVTHAKDADAYLRYLQETGLADYRGTPGNLGVLGLRRVVGERAEFFILSIWESQEAIRRFAGDDIGRAVFYPQDERFLIEKEERVSHFEVVFQAGLMDDAERPEQGSRRGDQ